MLETLYRIYPRLREAGGIRLVKAASGGQRSEIKKIDLDYYDIDHRIWESKRSLTIQSANLKMDKVEHFR